MLPLHTDISPAPSSPLSPVTGSPPWFRFALLCTLFLLAALWLEPHLMPLCRATAAQVGALLGLAGFAPRVQGDLVTVSGFTVRIVTECTPLYACLLYGAFVLAQPATMGRTVAGLFLGTMVITAANLLRITFVTAAGTVVAPILFDILHVYLGQIAMLMLVVAAGLFWLRWSAGAPAPMTFLFRAGIIATLFFVPWLVVNRSYVEILDNLVALVFSCIHPGYQLLTPRPFPIYNHTFAVPLFLALALAGRSVWRWNRIAVTVGGVFVIAGWHALFRVSHVVWTALEVPQIEPLHQAIYLLGQFLLPFLLWLWLDGRQTFRGMGEGALPGKPVILALLLALCWNSAAQAEPVVTIYTNGRDGFTIKADNLNRVTEAELNITYQSEDQTPPRVSGIGLGAKADIEVQADTPGSFTIRLKSSKPLSGSVQLATARIEGTVTFITGWFRNETGTAETPDVSIINPTEDQLSAMLARKTAKPAPGVAVPVVAKAPVTGAPAASVVSPAQPAASAASVQVLEPEIVSRPISFSHRSSVLELFRTFSQELTPAITARFFERSDDMFLQEPAVLLSDGAAALRLTIRTRDRLNHAPQFLISGGIFTAMKASDNGSWILEIVPEKGTLVSSVTVMTGSEMIEYPLVVAPPLELFDFIRAMPGDAEYVTTVNRLAVKVH
jgi:exosortase/archaeosortase family protein